MLNIKCRYFVQNDIRHTFLCGIYRARRKFCDCGLIHDLQMLDFSLAEILFVNYDHDLAVQEGRKIKVEPAQYKKSMELLE